MGGSLKTFYFTENKLLASKANFIYFIFKSSILRV